MTADEQQREAVIQILREVNLDSIFTPPTMKAVLFDRMEKFAAVYAKKVRGVPPGVLPASASLRDILAEHARNAHRVYMLLEAIAFQCSPEILVMAWMVLLGARIERVEYKYVREDSSALAVTLQLSDLTTEVTFQSSEHWDAAALRFLALSKANDQPMIEGFHYLWIPPRKLWNHDFYVETAQGSFGAADIAPTASPTPRWEIQQLFTNLPARDIGSVSVHVHGNPVFAHRGSEVNRPTLELAWNSLLRKYGDASMNQRPRREG
jgi:hypothetical protein